MTALAAALEASFEARLQLQYRTRHGRRTRAARSGAPHGNRRLDVTDHLLALRLRDHLDLPVKAVGALLGIDPGTVSHATALAGELLSAARITLPDAPRRENSPAPRTSSSPTPPRPASPSPFRKTDRPCQTTSEHAETGSPRHARDSQLNNRRGLSGR